MATAQRDDRWTTRYPGLGTGPIPVEPNISPEYFELEREKVFRRAWLNIGSAREIPEPGDYIVRDIEVLKTSLIIKRGGDSVIRGFHNVCKHRGNKLVRGCGGRAKGGFTCNFHGWTYDSAGRLAHVPDEEQFFDLNKCNYGLTPVATDLWNGFIFVNVDPEPRETLEQAMGEIGRQLKGYPFQSMEPVGRYTAEVKVNWKVFMVAFMECYHVPFLHRRTIPDCSTGRSNPLCHLLSVRLFDRHRSCSVYANPDHKPSQAELLAYKYGPTVIQGESAKNALPAGTNPEGHTNWAFDMNGFYPNLIIHVGNGFYYTLTFWPISASLTRWDVKLYMSPPKNAGERISQEFSKILTRDLYRKDLSTMENVQASLESGVLQHFPLSDQELLVRHSYKVIEDAVRAQ
ncbi:MAG TPA: aromatic ring-hydroxylating dioxygenase subunit alpha [Blastocatellia bacterium]|nr:aromatic ring-hydroxylating dioxygenase subunit alpha [Blastocatellia bacterium]